jgi:hypothetical protein
MPRLKMTEKFPLFTHVSGGLVKLSNYFLKMTNRHSLNFPVDSIVCKPYQQR